MTRRWDNETFSIRRVGTDQFVCKDRPITTSGFRTSSNLFDAMEFRSFEDAANWLYSAKDAEDFEILLKYNRNVLSTTAYPYDVWVKKVDQEVVESTDREARIARPPGTKVDKILNVWNRCIRVMKRDDFKYPFRILGAIGMIMIVCAVVLNRWAKVEPFTEAIYQSTVYGILIPGGVIALLILVGILLQNFVDEFRT